MTPDQLAQLLDELGKRLGPSGEYVFRIAVQRVVIEGVLKTVIGTAGLVAVLFMGFRLLRFATSHDHELSSDRDIFEMMGGLVLAVIAICAFPLLYDGVLRLLTPEYSALRDILSAIGGAK